jgi:pyruvate/2-oxoglutarate dehydrogenase complex dihydrolipoamide acyltransferase (E2) component
MARPGKLVKDAPPYRRMAAILFVRRNESAVYFEDAVDVTETMKFVDAWNAEPGAPRLTLFSLLLFALARTLHEHPRLNRFVAGRKLYQRDGVWLSFAAKKSMSPGAPLVEVKREFGDTETLASFLADMQSRLGEARSDAESKLDREVRWFLKIPHLLLVVLVRLVRVADFFGLLPASFIRDDPFFASAFLANLGSVGGAAAFHHLYEYGDIPLFVVLGKVREEVVASDGQAAVRSIARLRFSYDERIEDGFNAVRALATMREKLEHPESFVGKTETA